MGVVGPRAGGGAERRGNGLQSRLHGFKSRLHLGRLAQRESASLTRKRSLVQSQYRPPGPCGALRAISSAGERFPDTEEVTGSIPVSRTSSLVDLVQIMACTDHGLYGSRTGRARTRTISSAGERFPDTEEVTGSIPVSSTPYGGGRGHSPGLRLLRWRRLTTWGAIGSRLPIAPQVVTRAPAGQSVSCATSERQTGNRKTGSGVGPPHPRQGTTWR